MKRLLVIVSVIIVLVLVAIWVRGISAIDRCLDRGGSWDYGKEHCDYE
jgi:hypothetical protein